MAKKNETTKEVKEKKAKRNIENEVLEYVKTHDPLECSPRAIRDALGVGHSTVLRYLEILARTNVLKKTQVANTAFYQMAD